MPPPTGTVIKLRALKGKYPFAPRNLAMHTEDPDIHLLFKQLESELDDPTNEPLQAACALGMIPVETVAAIRGADTQRFARLMLERQTASMHAWLARIGAYHGWPQAEQAAFEFIATGSESGSAYLDNADGSFGFVMDHHVVAGFDLVAQDALYALYNGRPAEEWVAPFASFIAVFLYGADDPGYSRTRLALMRRNASLRGITDMLAEGLWLFVSAHELAHIRLGHLAMGDQGKSTSIPVSGDFAKLPSEQEFEADRWALETLRGLDRDTISGLLHQMAPAIYFSVACLKNAMFVPCLPAAVQQEGSHPPPEERLERLRYSKPRGPRHGNSPDLVDALITLPNYILAQLHDPGFQALAEHVRRRFGPR